MSFEILVIFYVNYVVDKLSLPSEWVASRPNSSEYIYIYISPVVGEGILKKEKIYVINWLGGVGRKGLGGLDKNRTIKEIRLH